MLASHPHGGPSELLIIGGFGLGGWDITDWFKQPPVIEPVDPFECGHLDSRQIAPRPALMNHFRLVEAVDRLGQRVDAPMSVKG